MRIALAFVGGVVVTGIAGHLFLMYLGYKVWQNT